MSDSDATRKKPPGTPPADPHKAALELRKLELEIKALTFKQSRLGRLTEILQGVVPILAILSLVWTVLVGLNQQEAQRKDAESARFERAFAKLGSGVPSERATGVAQASALLHVAGGERDRDILTALANQLALDGSPAVRSAILNVLSNLDHTTDAATLNATLKNIVDLHRVIVQSAGLTPLELSSALKSDRGIYFIPELADATETEQQVIDETFVRLESLRAALMALLKAGGRTRQMDHIYCPNCAFDALKVDFSEVSFQNAILPGTQWSLVRLARSNFKDAVLIGADFTGAMLEGADLSADEYNTHQEEYIAANAIRHRSGPQLPSVLDEFETHAPTFICANLKDAKFSGRVLFSRFEEGSASQSSDNFLRAFLRANIAGADFREGREVAIRPMEAGEEQDPYVRQHRVAASERNPKAYYYRTITLTWLDHFQRGRHPAQDREQDLTLQAMAESFVMADNIEAAQFPEGVHGAIKALRATAHPSTFPTCEVYLKDLRDSPALNSTSPRSYSPRFPPPIYAALQ